MASYLCWPRMTFSVPCRLGSRDFPRELLSWTCFSLFDSLLLHYQQCFSLGSVNVLCFLFFFTFCDMLSICYYLCKLMVKIRQYVK